MTEKKESFSRLDFEPGEDIEFINSFSVLKLAPTDIIVFKTDEVLRIEVHEAIRAQFKRVLQKVGLKNEIIILENGADIGILSMEGAENE